MWNFATFDVTSVLVGRRINLSSPNKIFVTSVMDCATSETSRKKRDSCKLWLSCCSVEMYKFCSKHMRSWRVLEFFFTWLRQILSISVTSHIRTICRTSFCQKLFTIMELLDDDVNSSSLTSLRSHVAIVHVFRLRREEVSSVNTTPPDYCVEAQKRCRYRYHNVQTLAYGLDDLSIVTDRNTTKSVQRRSIERDLMRKSRLKRTKRCRRWT